MNNFEIYKMKRAGLTNHQVLNVLRYAESRDGKLSLRDKAVVSECRNPALFIEKYKRLDLPALKEEFELFRPFLSWMIFILGIYAKFMMPRPCYSIKEI